MDTLAYINERKEERGDLKWTGGALEEWEGAASYDGLSILKRSYGFKFEHGEARLRKDYGGLEKKIIVSGTPITPQVLRLNASTHDSTLAFTHLGCRNLFKGIVEGSCYGLDSCPSDYEENFFKYIVSYKIADVLYLIRPVKHMMPSDDNFSPGVEEIFACAVEIDYIPLN